MKVHPDGAKKRIPSMILAVHPSNKIGEESEILEKIKFLIQQRIFDKSKCTTESASEKSEIAKNPAFHDKPLYNQESEEKKNDRRKNSDDGSAIWETFLG